MNNIIIKGAREGNLKDISLEIPRNKLVILTGVSGSGKSTLAIDTIYQECQRQYLEAMSYQGIQKPDVDSIKNLSPAITITQTEYNKNPRSSVGTSTDIYTSLRMIYEKLGKRSCPSCNHEIYSHECREETEKLDDDFKVYMYCNHCGYKMDKITRTYFSYNTREGACPKCEGLGEVLDLDKGRVVNENLSLEEGAVDFWANRYKDYQIDCIKNTFKKYGIDYKENTKVEDFTKEQKALLFYGTDSEEAKELFKDMKTPKTVGDGKFEGIFTTIWRKISEKGSDSKESKSYFTSKLCRECGGERLNDLSRSVSVLDRRLPELVKLSLEELDEFIDELDKGLDKNAKKIVEPYILDLKTKLNRIVNVGLGYLNIDRQMMTLSGGEGQRIKLSATLDSDMTGIIYILDEPTAGLHPKDTKGIISILKSLRDKGNSIIVIEHDLDVMREADYLIDIGPGAGKHGGEIVGRGTLEELLKEESSVTGNYLRKEVKTYKEYREHNYGYIEVRGANLYNLKNINADFPIGAMTTVTGVSGSGKSTLVFEVLANEKDKVEGLEKFDNIITVVQSPLTRMRRSNVATYSDLYTEIRNVYSSLREAKEGGFTSKHFSFNTSGGRCDNCEGLGYVVSNMLFFEDLEVECPVCKGSRFKEDVLKVKYKDKNINDILNTSIEEAVEIFNDNEKILDILTILKDVGLGYLELGQTLTTLSGGEGQRLKLAKELINNKGKNNLYLIDEPTVGLHPVDVENFLVLLHRLVDLGNTVIVVEHNQEVIKSSDWIIDLGPEGGINGGEVIAVGTPDEIVSNKSSITGQFLEYREVN